MSHDVPIIVDSHVHFWDPGKLRYAWLDGLPVLNRPMLPTDLANASASLRLSKFIFVESSCDASQSLAEVNWITGLAETEPRLKGIVASAPLERGKAARADLESLARHPLVKGVRRNLQGEGKDFLKRPELIEGLNLLPEFGFIFDLCVRADQLPMVNELVRSLPQVTFVLDHFGKPAVRNRSYDPWARDIRALADLPNVSCKISGLTTEADWAKWRNEDLEPYFKHALDCFGFDRILFGGDWPVATLATSYHRWVETVLALVPDASDRERTQLFQTNAERIYRV
ncbi:MAG TPA: amidohydrolase family protein [Verrucomicrobiae bacterium]|jgi:L-fuconolactonase|nr:amidohydrolase family protein [Verrucomicrobiae bacterium]